MEINKQCSPVEKKLNWGSGWYLLILLRYGNFSLLMRSVNSLAMSISQRKSVCFSLWVFIKCCQATMWSQIKDKMFDSSCRDVVSSSRHGTVLLQFASSFDASFRCSVMSPHYSVSSFRRFDVSFRRFVMSPRYSVSSFRTNSNNHMTSSQQQTFELGRHVKYRRSSWKNRDL